MEISPEHFKGRNLKVMDTPVTMISVNPAGETKSSPHYPSETWPLDTPGGRFYAECWDDQAPVTREGQLIFFFQSFNSFK